MMTVNLWRRFGDLIKPAPQEVVTITALHDDGTVTATTMGGGVLRLRNAVSGLAVNDRAFAQAGEVKAKAPILPFYELEV